MDMERLQALINDKEALQALVGRPVRYAEQACHICDIIFEDNLLIISTQCCEDMQDDSYGRPRRKAPGYHSLHFRGEDGNPSHIWEELIFLDGNGLF